MVSRAGSADLYRALVVGIGEVGVRDRDAQVAARAQERVAQGGRRRALLRGQVLPDVLAEQRVDPPLPEQRDPPLPAQQVEILALRREPAGPALVARAQGNAQRGIRWDGEVIEHVALLPGHRPRFAACTTIV